LENLFGLEIDVLQSWQNMENSQKRPRVETVFLGKAPAAEKPFSCVKINGNKN